MLTNPLMFSALVPLSVISDEAVWSVKSVDARL